MNKDFIFKWLPFCMVMLICSGCMKDFLDVKRDKSQVTPESLDDFRAVLDDNGYMNYNFPGQLATIGADEYYVEPAQWAALTSPIAKNAYVWNDEVYEGGSGDDWNRGFEKIMFANFVMEGVTQITESAENRRGRDELLGESHFYRAMSFFLLAQLFCEQYADDTASTALGLPLRTTANINVHFPRSTLADTYSFIMNDITDAVRLLPVETEANTRPSKVAALTLGAMVYMQMGKYGESLKLAEEAFSLKNELLDYNELNVDASNPFSQYGRDNPEILFYCQMVSSPILSNTRLNVDSNLYDSYLSNDLRKPAFYRFNAERLIYKGGYTGITTSMFTGLTTAEIYLLIAECKARTEPSSEGAIWYVNELLRKRMQSENFQKISSNLSRDECMNIIINERKKELVFRGRRWQDLRRYKDEGRLTFPLIRRIGNEKFTLPIKSNKWVWPIPPDVITIGGIEQNPR